MMANLNAEELSRLADAIRKSRMTLRFPREQRREMVRQYAGNHWAEEAANKRRPVNLLSLYANVVQPALVAKEPRTMLSTFSKPDKPAVKAAQSWANKQLVKMRFAETMQQVVLDALFGFGILKVALSTSADAAAYGWNLPAGTAFAERVPLDDFVFDAHTRDLRKPAFIGHRYRCQKDVAIAMFGRKAKDLPVSTDSAYNLEGDERTTAMFRIPYAQQDQEFEDMVDLWEIYIPRRRLVLTLPDFYLGGPWDDEGAPLRQQEWLGPDCGPYHVLAYRHVPDAPLPKGPMMDLWDLDEAVNRLYRKLIQQGERQKEIATVQQGATEDGGRIVQAGDGDMVRVDNPDSVKVVAYGGPNQQNFQLANHLIDRFSWEAGNLDIQGGLSPQSKTATQDKLLAQNASAGVADMQAVTVRFTSEAVGALLWYWWNDPFQTMRDRYSLPGMPEMQVERRVAPQQRQRVKYEDLEIDIDPYSMTHQTPQAKVQAVTQVIGTLAPLMGLAQQQGVMIDVNALVEKFSRFLDLPELVEIMSVVEPPQQDSPPAGAEEEAGPPAETTRNYVRESVSAGPSMQARMGMAPQLMGQGRNGSAGGEVKPGM